MTMPFYVSPEQVMKDRADYARRNIARGALKKLYREDLDAQGCMEAVVQALYDAADDDSATGGPDLTRRIFPVIQVITIEGGHRVDDDEVARIADRVIAGRMNRPDGPAAGLARSGGSENGDPT